MTRPPLLTAILHPANLAMLALTAAAGLCSAWWLAPVGILFWLVMVIVIARDPGLQMTFVRQNRQPLSQRFQTPFDRMERTRFSSFNAIARASNPAVQRSLQSVQDALDSLVEHAYRISLHLTTLDNNLAVQKLSGNSDDQITTIQQKLSGAREEASRKEYADALQSLQSRRNQLAAVADLLSRFETQLTGTSSAVESVATAVLSIPGSSPKQAADKAPALLQVLRSQDDELKQFDEVLEKTSFVA